MIGHEAASWSRLSLRRVLRERAVIFGSSRCLRLVVLLQATREEPRDRLSNGCRERRTLLGKHGTTSGSYRRPRLPKPLPSRGGRSAAEGIFLRPTRGEFLPIGP